MNILITGTSRGIGAEICRNFAKGGEHKIFMISRNKTGLDNLVESIKKINNQTFTLAIPLDITKEKSVTEIKKEVTKLVGHIDILINNAGHIVVKKFVDFSPEEILSQFAVNYLAPAALIKEFIPMLLKAPKPHVVNISSMSGFQGSDKYPGLSHYSGSKAAIASLTECLAKEYYPDIAFNALCLGAVQTEMLKEAFPGYTAPVKAKEMADYICDFALKAHRFMTGKIIPVSLVDP